MNWTRIREAVEAHNAYCERLYETSFEYRMAMLFGGICFNVFALWKMVDIVIWAVTR